MIRTSKHILKFANKEKLNILDKIYDDCKNQIDVYINQIISGDLILNDMMSSPQLSNEFIVHASWKQVCYSHASNIIAKLLKQYKDKRYKNYARIYFKLKEQNRYNKFTSKKFSELKLNPIQQTKYFTKPSIKNITINLNINLIEFSSDKSYSKEFDSFVNLTTPYKKSKGRYIHANIPIKYHKHSNRFRGDINWKLKNTIGLQKINGNYYFNLVWEKEEPIKKSTGNFVGFDIGYKKLLISSENKIYDDGLEKVYEKISRKKQDSKNFKKALIERDNLINQSLNKIDMSGIQTIVVEDLKNVKKDSKGKINKKFNNKLQRWSYPKVLSKLSMVCEEQGINLIKVDPAYTSQTCSKCGSIHKESRKGEHFKCIDCNYELDADYNASINILHRGIYGSSTTENPTNIIKGR
jgi:putative transposase